MTLNQISDQFAPQYEAALEQVDKDIATARKAEREVLRAARVKLVEFKEMPLSQKNAVQKRLRSSTFSGSAQVDDMISAFTIFPEYMDELKITVPERLSMQKESTKRLEAKASSAITVQASELISKCKWILKDVNSRPFDTACALALTCGRRACELFKVGQLTAVDDHSMLFSGQAKKSEFAEATSYLIPALAPPALITAALERLRKQQAM